jgi:hypothetical protein
MMKDSKGIRLTFLLLGTLILLVIGGIYEARRQGFRLDRSGTVFGMSLERSQVDNNPIAEKGPNIIANPRFEQGRAEAPQDWTLFGDSEWVPDRTSEGGWVVRVQSQGGSSGVTSDLIPVPSNARLEISARIKAQDVVDSGGFHSLRLTVSVYEADQVSRIRHWDIVAAAGTFDWREFKGYVTTPPKTRYMTVTAQLTNTSGSFWVDRISASIVQTIPALDLPALQKPIVIPNPVRMEAAEGRFLVEDVRIVAPERESRFRVALTSYLEGAGIEYHFQERPGSLPPGGILLAGDRSLLAVDEQLERAFPGSRWESLGEQGYFLSVQNSRQGLRMYLGANSEQGRFYALQTLKQLIDEDQHIAPVNILDQPSLERRGIMMGVHWYNERDESFRRLAEMKLNFVWNQGAFVNDKFRFRWREPLNGSEKSDLKSYLALAQANFIDPYISISPKSMDASSPPIYSSEAEIQAVVSKMKDLYQLGFRNFGLSFDDLSNYGLERLYGQDVQVWGNDIGKAHVHFIGQVYRQLKDEHADISFMVVPMTYAGIINASASATAYLEQLSELPAEIEFFTALEYVEEMETAARLTGRPHFMMDNFWARFYREQKPEFALPLDRPTDLGEGFIAGYAFLPSLPSIEDLFLVSWRTAAEYAWAPERYNPEAAFQRAAARPVREIESHVR